LVPEGLPYQAPRRLTCSPPSWDAEDQSTIVRVSVIVRPYVVMYTALHAGWLRVCRQFVLCPRSKAFFGAFSLLKKKHPVAIGRSIPMKPFWGVNLFICLFLSCICIGAVFHMSITRGQHTIGSFFPSFYIQTSFYIFFVTRTKKTKSCI